MKLKMRGWTLARKLQAIVSRALPTPDGCLIAQDIGFIRGYATLKHNGLRSHVGRLMLIESGIDMTGLVARHKCRRRDCINIDHIEPGTQSQNAKEDKYRDDTTPLSRDIVEKIRAMGKQGVKKVDMARVFGVHYTTVSDIVNNISYNYDDVERVSYPHLSELDVLCIREIRKQGMKATDIAPIFSVTPASIRRIVTYAVYKNIA